MWKYNFIFIILLFWNNINIAVIIINIDLFFKWSQSVLFPL